ncbi:aspartyl-phosphate phosphatase Spo0E family protein [Halobacillus litoralis]|uniref:aspartyl-phosphate phosphatase Spo0E family protein n=1 Tax=Halobacillus litoralis TaxID=45668 RepID=UPI001CD3E1BB|nr:aspartyl-phosphate phosphatase Spo0E family protein [Halobacillus litoralis]MCA0970218.1 aspartyl-phosphate phosphatase Spo0E family protein [Halobacillus litoralis]
MTHVSLEKEIEDIRSEMYHAHLNDHKYEDVLKISQKLDQALNRLYGMSEEPRS